MWKKRNGAFFRWVKSTTNAPPARAATGGTRHGQGYQQAGRLQRRWHEGMDVGDPSRAISGSNRAGLQCRGRQSSVWISRTDLLTGTGILAADRYLQWHRAVAPGVEAAEITTHGLALSRPRRGFESRWGHHKQKGRRIAPPGSARTCGLDERFCRLPGYQ